MPDREKVIKGLECLTQRREPTANPCKRCGYINRPNFSICVKDIASDALELLKEQEPQETRLVRHYSRPGVYADLWLHCEKCGGKIDYGPYRPKFCPECGRKVKWND